MKGLKIKIDDVKTSSSFDMTKLVMKFLAISKNLNLSETELHALTYFVMNGYSDVSKEKLIEIKLLKHKQAVYNLIYHFKKHGVIVKENLGWNIHKDYLVYTEDIDIIKLEMLIKK